MSKSASQLTPISVAVVGLGRAGWDLHVAALRQDPRYRIVSVADADAERRRQAQTELGCEAYRDDHALLKQTDAELVVIASPSLMHGRQAMDAFAAGRHVLVEKPMATTLREADRMIAAAKTARRILFPYQRRRFSREFTFLENLVSGGRLGKCFHIGFCSQSYVRRFDWQCLLKNGGGQLNNSGSHFLDLILALLDSPVKEVLCDMKRICSAGDAEDHVKMFLRTQQGMTADLEVTMAAATTRRAPTWTLLGTRGAATVERDVAEIKYYDPARARPVRLNPSLAVPGREYIYDGNLPWRKRKCAAQGPDVGSFYDGVFKTLRQGSPFRVRPEEIREMIRVMELCRRQNPAFAQ